MVTKKYQQEIQAFRQELNGYLVEENGWLALAGLFWLAEGENPFGSAQSSTVLLPDQTLPETMGIFYLNGDTVRMVAEPDVHIEVDGQPLSEATLSIGGDGKPTFVKLGDIQMIVLKRGTQFAIRLWDNSRVARKQFTGRVWYPIQEACIIQAHYQRFDQPQAVMIPRSIGEDMPLQTRGELQFMWQGEPQALLVTELDTGELSLIFKDETSGKTTYGAGRYLTIERPHNDGSVTLDFNRAYHPPCAFTDYATCPFPPKQNHLYFSVEAGERYPI
ncbi:MAG: DUF1684 domain-containing protein [Chloroflexota bacterium]